MVFVCHPKILHKHCLQFLLGVKMAPRETANNAYAKFWDDKQKVLWCVVVFSGVVNYHVLFLIILGFVKKKTTTTTLQGVIPSEGHTPNCVSHRSFLCFCRHFKCPRTILLGGGAGGLGVGFSLCHELNLCLATTRELPSNSTSDQSEFYAKLC